eukprot:scaffold2305_cov145-Skeletonema_menzelii.AAC.11
MKDFETISASVEERYKAGHYNHADNESSDRNRSKRKRKQTNRFVDETSKEYREKPPLQRRKKSLKVREETDNDEERLAKFPKRLKRRKTTFTLEDSSSDECDDGDVLSNKYHHQKLMERRIENIKTRDWIDNEDDSSNSGFNLVRAMNFVDNKEDDEGSEIEERRYQLQQHYNNTQMEKRHQIALRLEADRTNALTDTLFDADLSDGEDERVNRDSSLSIGNIQVNGSNNNISINLAQPIDLQSQRGNDYMMYQSQCQYFVPSVYHRDHLAIDESTQQIHPSYHITPRFLTTSETSRQSTRIFPMCDSIVSTIKSKVKGYYHLLSDKEKIWVSKLVDIAMLTDNRMPITISQRTWVYNERARHKGNEWKVSASKASVLLRDPKSATLTEPSLLTKIFPPFISGDGAIYLLVPASPLECPKSKILMSPRISLGRSLSCECGNEVKTSDTSI